MAPSPLRWLLIRGLTREARHWDPFPAVLEARVPGLVAARLDLPGVGTENGRPSPRTIDGIVDDLRARWLAQDGAQPFGLLSISLGGMVALSWTARFPREVERLILINSSAANVSPPHHRLRLGMLPRVLAGLATNDPLARERSILKMTTNTRGDDEAIARRWADFATERPLTRGVAAAQILAATRFKAPNHIEVPALVINGAGDRFTDPRCSQRLAARLGCPLVVHPDGGHDLPSDAPDWVADRVAEAIGA